MGNVLEAKVKVDNHSFNSNGVCSCGASSIEVPYDVIEKLEYFDIMHEYEDGTFMGGKTVTRAEAARLLVNLMNLADLAEEETGNSFSDIEENYWARGYIELVNKKDILKGYPDGTFRPNDPITHVEFFTCVLNVLGYGDVVASEGTWPSNVMDKCEELDLLADVPYNRASDDLTRGAAAVVCYNALETRMWVKTGVGHWELGERLEDEKFYGVGDFYTLISDGVWNTSTSSGKEYYVELANEDEEDTYEITSSAAKTKVDGEALDSLEYYLYLEDKTKEPIFLWAGMNDDGVIDNIVEVADGDECGRYTIVAFEGGLDEDNYLKEDHKVTKVTTVLKAVPVVDENNEVIDVILERHEGPDALEDVDSGLLAYETLGGSERAVYVFIKGEKSTEEITGEIQYALIEKYSESRGVEYVTIDGIKCEVGENPFDIEEGDVILYTLDEDELIIIEAVVKPTDVDDNKRPKVTKVEGELIYFSNGLETIDIESDEVIEAYKDTMFVLVNGMMLDTTGEVEFTDLYYPIDKGIGSTEFTAGDRVFFEVVDGVASVICGFYPDEVIEEGIVVESVDILD